MLTAIGLREVPIPDHMDIYHLTREIDATDMTSLQAVMNVDEERLVLEKEAEKLSQQVSPKFSAGNSLSFSSPLVLTYNLRAYVTFLVTRWTSSHAVFIFTG